MNLSQCAKMRGVLGNIRFDSTLDFFEVIDIDGSGLIDKQEFVEGLISLWLAQNDQVPEELFLILKIQRISKRKIHAIELDMRSLADCFHKMNTRLGTKTRSPVLSA